MKTRAILVVAAVAAAGAVALWIGTRKPSVGSAARPSIAAAVPRFTDVAKSAGVDFTHRSFATPAKYLIETMGGGAALFDADGDGDLDLYLVQGAPPPGDATPRPPNRLFRNEGGLRFVDATQEAALSGSAYGQGCAAGDADGDGDADLFVSNFGPDLFFRNLGEGRFEERADAARVGDPGWGTSAAFFDADLDGDLDLYAASYVKAAYAGHPSCRPAGRASYCHPDNFVGAEDRFYRNEGDGTFTETGESAGVARAGPFEGKGLGMVPADFDDDSIPDLFVANDSTPSFLYRGRGDGTFEEDGLLAGVAYSLAGRCEAGMGTDAADADGDGLLDLVVTNLNFETHRLRRNLGHARFEDVTEPSGLARATYPFVGFGAGFVDADNDGALDLLLVNGHVIDNVAEADPSQSYRQPARFLRNRGGTDGFEDATTRAGDALARPRPGRGAAFGDLDDDGRVDVVVTNCGDPVELLRNEGVGGRRWIRFRLVGVRGVRDGLGADLRLTAGNRVARRVAKSAYSYLCANDPRVHFGLGSVERIERLEVRWPSGRVDAFAGLAVDREHRIVEGTGVAP